MIKRLPDTFPDATCADPATPTAHGRDDDHDERWQAGVCAYIAEGSADGQVCADPVGAARARWRQRGGRLMPHVVEVPAPDLDDEPPTFDLSTAGGIARYVRHLAREAVAAEVARSPLAVRAVLALQDVPLEQVTDPGARALAKALQFGRPTPMQPAQAADPDEIVGQAAHRAGCRPGDLFSKVRDMRRDLAHFEAEAERLEAEVDRLSGRTAASELARLSREAREVRQALDMPDAAHDAVVAAIASMRREGADLLAREAALRMAAARQTGWECPTTYEGVRAQVRLMDDLREQGKAAVADLRRWHDLLRADLGAVLCALGVPDAIEHVGTPHFEGALARASNAARALEAAAPARDLATAVRDFVGGVSYADRPGEREAALVAELTKVGDAFAEVRQALQAAPGGLDPEVRADDPAGLLRAVAGRLRSLAERPAPDGPSGGQRQPEAAGEATTPPGDLVRAYDADTSPGDDAWDALLCWEGQGCEVRAWPEDKPVRQERRNLGGKVVELRRQHDGREVVFVRSDAPETSAPDWDSAPVPPARLAAGAASEELPRVVGWSDLQPGDLAWDANSFSSLLLVRKSGRAQWRHQYDGSPASGTFGLTGQRVTDNTPDAPQAILVARDVKGNASAVRRAWAPAKDRARALAEQARQEGA